MGATTAADEAVASAWRKAFNGGGPDGCLGRSGLAFPGGSPDGCLGRSGPPTATAASAASAAGATAAGSVDDRHGGAGCRPLMLLAGGRGGVLGTGRFRSPPGDALSAG